MKKCLFDMRFQEIPRWIVLLTYALFILLLIPFTIPISMFSYVCFGLWMVLGVVYLVIVLAFPIQKVREMPFNEPPYP